MTIAAVYVYVRHHRTPAELKRGEHKGRLQKIKILPKTQDIQTLKKEIAKAVLSVGAKAKYYYVTVAARRPNKTLGYRVVIKKTAAA